MVPMAKKFTYIRITPEARKRLKEVKSHPRISYSDTIESLIDFFQAKKDEKEVLI